LSLPRTQGRDKPLPLQLIPFERKRINHPEMATVAVHPGDLIKISVNFLLANKGDGSFIV
jgi:hypothetical protein